MKVDANYSIVESSLAWTMKNGKRIGEMTEYKHGKALQKENWDSILNNDGYRRMIENSKEGLIMVIQCKREYDENAMNEDVVIYRGEFDEEMKRDGYRIEWDTDNGKERVGGVDLYEGWYLTGMNEKYANNNTIDRHNQWNRKYISLL